MIITTTIMILIILALVLSGIKLFNKESKINIIGKKEAPLLDDAIKADMEKREVTQINISGENKETLADIKEMNEDEFLESLSANAEDETVSEEISNPIAEVMDFSPIEMDDFDLDLKEESKSVNINNVDPIVNEEMVDDKIELDLKDETKSVNINNIEPIVNEEVVETNTIEETIDDEFELDLKDETKSVNINNVDPIINEELESTNIVELRLNELNLQEQRGIDELNRSILLSLDMDIEPIVEEIVDENKKSLTSLDMEMEPILEEIVDEVNDELTSIKLEKNKIIIEEDSIDLKPSIIEDKNDIHIEDTDNILSHVPEAIHEVQEENKFNVDDHIDCPIQNAIQMDLKKRNLLRKEASEKIKDISEMDEDEFLASILAEAEKE